MCLPRSISAVPNRHFYGGRLVDGCSAEQRTSLLPGLPSLAFLDVRGQEQYGAGAEGRFLPESCCWRRSLAGAKSGGCVFCQLLLSAAAVPGCTAGRSCATRVKPIPCLHACPAPAGRSASNQAEAEAVLSVVERLAGAGVALGRIGVICFFRAQAALVRTLMERRLPQLQQAEQRRQEAAELAGGSSRCKPGAAKVDAGVVDLLVGGSKPRRSDAARRASEAGEADEGCQAVGGPAQQGIQVATVDSFQVSGRWALDRCVPCCC